MASASESLKAALADRYEIERELGQGGMATVYLAQDLKHRRHVAIKVLKPELTASVGSDRFLQEIRTTANLRHPHIVPLYDSGEADEFLFYVMPFIEGESLRDRLDREAQLSVDESLRLSCEIAGALAYAHARGIIHRDIKPANIMLEAGHAVVSDFGIASAVSLAGGQRLTQTGMIVGTPAYMSPEQASGQGEVDARSDLYSLACVTYEMLAGQQPFTAPTAAVVLARHMFDPVPPLTTARPGLAVHIAQAVERAMAKTPIDRLDSLEMWATALTTPVPTAPAVQATAPAVDQTSAQAVGTPSSVAVVPFANLSGDPSQDFFVAGMHDAIISQLAKIGAITVISRTSVMRYRDSDASIPEIADQLGVEAVMEGSVLKAGDRVRISLQLMRAKPERHLWSESYERDLTDVLALHGEVAQSVAGAISAKLTTDEVQRLSRTVAVDPAAYELFLRGRHLNLGMDEQAYRRIAFLEQAIERAPEFAPAHASLARTLMWLVQLGIEPSSTTLRAREAVTRALELDPESGEVLAASGYFKTMFDWDPEAGGRDLARAIELEPNNVEALQDLAWHLTIVGDFDQSVEIWERAVRLDPFSPMLTMLHGWTLYLARRWEDSIATLESGMQRAPDFPLNAVWLAAAYRRIGNHDRSLELCRRAEELDRSGSNRDLLAVLSLVYKELGSTEDAHRIAQQIEARSGQAGGSWFMALAAYTRDDREGAVEWFGKAADERFPMMVLLPIHPIAEDLLADLRMVDIANRVNIRPGFTVAPPASP